jgi:hypothetical protein
MSTTTARHLTPPAPPREPDPFILGPFLLELVLTLAFTLGPLYYSGLLVYRWVYLVDNTPPLVVAALACTALMTAVGHCIVGWMIGVRAASALATVAAYVEVAARRLWRAFPQRGDAGQITVEQLVWFSAALGVVTLGVVLFRTGR